MSNTEAPLKQSAVIQECDTKDESIVHISKILIKLKVSRNFMKAKMFVYSFFWQSWSATKSKKKIILISPFFFEITTAFLGLMQQNNVLYQSIEIGAGFRIVWAQPDWAYEFPDRTPKFAGHVLLDRTESRLISIKISPTYQVQIITSHKIKTLNTTMVSKVPRLNK